MVFFSQDEVCQKVCTMLWYILPSGVKVVKIKKLEGCPSTHNYQVINEKGGWFVGRMWNGSYHAAEFSSPYIISWVMGRKKKMKRVNRFFREARKHIKDLPYMEVDPVTLRFKAREQVRGGD